VPLKSRQSVFRNLKFGSDAAELSRKW
jgi:hypothetical protein